MHWCSRLGVFWCGGVFVSTVILLAFTSPGLAITSISQTLQRDAEPTEPEMKVVQTPPAPRPDPLTNPNENRLLQPLPTPAPIPSDQPPVITPPTPTNEPLSPEQEPGEQSQPVRVNKINVTGSTVFSAKEINPIIQPLEGRSVTLQALRSAAQAISDLYLRAGYITSRADLVEASVNTGTVQISVIEAGIQEIRVVGTRRLNSNYVRSRIRLGVGRPLNARALEEQLRLLRIDPLFKSVEASLQAGTGEGQSILTVRVRESDPFKVDFSIDNNTPPSVAPERATLGLRYRNLTGIGDELAASYTVGFNLEKEFDRAALNVYDVSYRAPLNPMDGTVQFRAVPYYSGITQREFASLGIEGNATLYELSYRQPLIRTLRQELALSLGFTLQDGQTFIGDDQPYRFGFGPDADGNSRTRVLRFGQQYISRDTQGTWVLNSQLNFGLGIFGATENRAPTPDGSFFSFQGQVQRAQLLGNDYQLIVQGSLQLAADSLLPSQQFFIGGGQSLRGYRQNVRAGDNGVLLSVEGRIPLLRDSSGIPNLQVAPFTDLGGVWNVSGNPNSLGDQTFLASVGLGLLWRPTPDLNLRLDFAVPFFDVENEGSSQDQGIHFSLSYSPF